MTGLLAISWLMPLKLAVVSLTFSGKMNSCHLQLQAATLGRLISLANDPVQGQHLAWMQRSTRKPTGDGEPFRMRRDALILANQCGPG